MHHSLHGIANGYSSENAYCGVLNFVREFSMIQTVEAQIDEHGHIRLLEPLKLARPSRALVTILPPEAKEENESALLSEASLAVDWSREEEDKAWAHLQ